MDDPATSTAPPVSAMMVNDALDDGSYRAWLDGKWDRVEEMKLEEFAALVADELMLLRVRLQGALDHAA